MWAKPAALAGSSGEINVISTSSEAVTFPPRGLGWLVPNHGTRCHCANPIAGARVAQSPSLETTHRALAGMLHRAEQFSFGRDGAGTRVATVDVRYENPRTHDCKVRTQIPPAYSLPLGMAHQHRAHRQRKGCTSSCCCRPSLDGIGKVFQSAPSSLKPHSSLASSPRQPAHGPKSQARGRRVLLLARSDDLDR